MGCSDRSFEGVLLACDLDGTLLSPDGTLHPDNVASLREFLAAGGHLPQCAALEHATEAYRRSEDWLSNFITDTCELGANQRCGAQELYQAYRNWALSTGEYCRRQTDFNEAMSGQGFQKIIPGNRKTWLGLRLTITEYGTGAASLMA